VSARRYRVIFVPFHCLDGVERLCDAEWARTYKIETRRRHV
jgi:hypothetical protein